MMRLYNHPNSGNCYKIRLFLALIGQACEIVPVDVAQRQHKQSEFLRLNPRGQIPVFEEGAVVLFDSQAILAYLALRYAPSWTGLDAAETGQVFQWLSFAAKELSVGLQAARLHWALGVAIDIDAATTAAWHSLEVLSGWLEDRQWIACGRPTIADIACYPYVSLASEAHVDLADFPAVQRWLEQIESLDGYEAMRKPRAS